MTEVGSVGHPRERVVVLYEVQDVRRDTLHVTGIRVYCKTRDRGGRDERVRRERERERERENPLVALLLEVENSSLAF